MSTNTVKLTKTKIKVEDKWVGVTIFIDKHENPAFREPAYELKAITEFGGQLNNLETIYQIVLRELYELSMSVTEYEHKEKVKRSRFYGILDEE